MCEQTRKTKERKILQPPTHAKLPTGQQDPGPHIVANGQHWRPSEQGKYPGTQDCLSTRPLRALRTGTSSTWRVRGTMWRFALTVCWRMGVGPSYRFKRKDKSRPSSASKGDGSYAREITGSRSAETSTTNFMGVEGELAGTG